MHCIKKFNYNHESNACFNTYAYRAVWSKIQKFVLESRYIIKVPLSRKDDPRYKYKVMDFDKFSKYRQELRPDTNDFDQQQKRINVNQAL